MELDKAIQETIEDLKLQYSWDYDTINVKALGIVIEALELLKSKVQEDG